MKLGSLSKIFNPKRSIPRYIRIKLTKIKNKENFKSSQKKFVTYKVTPIKLTAESQERVG